MSVISNRRSFTFSFGTLQRDAQRLLEALHEPTLGAPVVTRLPATFVADFTAQIALAAKLGTDKCGAIGTLATHTLAQQQALAEFARLASIARRAATLAFPGDDTLLRSEFMFGVHRPEDIPSLLDRARAFVAACQKYPDPLALHGWSAADTVELEAALTAATNAGHEQGNASDAKLGTTARRIDAVNLLYKQCLVVQIGARKVYSPAQVLADASLVEGRARFLLDEFPPCTRASASAPAAPAAALNPAAPAPTPPAVEPLAA